MTQDKSEKQYAIVYKKLEEILKKDKAVPEAPREMSREEFDEIDELRRLSLEVEDPEPQFHTTT